MKITNMTFCLLFLSSSLVAQVDSTRRTTIFFDSNGEKAESPVVFTEKPKQDREYRSNAIKVGIIDIFTGMYGMHLEKELSGLFSLQIGGGLTRKNLIQQLTNVYDVFDESPFFKAPDIDVADNHYDYNTREVGQGYFFTMQPKLYYNEDGFEGAYVGLIYLIRQYNFKAYNISKSSSSILFVSNSFLNEYERHNIFGAAWGYQFLSEHSIVDCSISLGINNMTAKRRDVGMSVNIDGTYTPQVVLTGVKKPNLYAEVSFKTGFYWKKKSKTARSIETI